jgi:hypothetical protein
LQENVVLTLVGVSSLVIALKSPGWAGWTFALIGPLLWIHGEIFGKRVRLLAEKLPVAP